VRPFEVCSITANITSAVWLRQRCAKNLRTSFCTMAMPPPYTAVIRHTTLAAFSIHSGVEGSSRRSAASTSISGSTKTIAVPYDAPWNSVGSQPCSGTMPPRSSSASSSSP
jgi:hypothetical protein